MTLVDRENHQAQKVDLDRRVVEVDGASLPYDFLILAVGATTTYFGHDEWAEIAPPMKCLNDAIEVRRRRRRSDRRRARRSDRRACAARPRP